MQGISTITQKGQVAIPKVIRDHFKLNPYHKIRFIVKNGEIVGQPLPSASEMLGIVKTDKKISKKDEKMAIKKRVLQKYENRA